jgi:hypothetical protein
MGVQRRRTIASSPARSATATWATISTVVADTLDRSPVIPRAEVEDLFRMCAGVGRHLVAGGHLERHDIVVVATPVHLSIGTVSGTDAFGLDENLNPVPGGASAIDWTVYLPTPDPMEAAVRELASKLARLSADPPPALAAAMAASPNGRGTAIDLAAVARRLGGAQ